MIGNCTSAALVSSEGSIDWLCIPNFDSPSVFAKILDEKKGGYFKISGIDTTNMAQKYKENTAILTTLYETAHGVFEVNDYMPRFVTPRGVYFCPSEIHRKIHVISGHPKIKVELDARPNYALGGANYVIHGEYLKITSQSGHYNSFYLYSDLDYEKIVKGDSIDLPKYSFILLSYHEKLEEVNNDKIYLEYEKTKTYWLDWVRRTHFPEKYKKDVIRSAITLDLLTYQHTGAVIAAPTTSLPEIIGKDRNWDYRFCWVRDASMLTDLYLRMGHMNSATRFINFVLRRMLLKHENINVMYGINGEEELRESYLDHLDGYAGSKPVRIGNEAYRQKQNDLYGELIETIYTYFVVNRHASFQVNEEIWTVVRSLVNAVIDSWRKTDSGIWERRTAEEHYVHSKVMSWVAMDRAVKIARYVRKPHHIEHWQRIADEIKEDILKNGWNDRLKSFSMSYGSDTFDASNLLMLHYGFLDKSDPRMVSTVEKTYQNLVQQGFTFRYTEDDDFGTPENAFIVCTFWMINALYLIGEERKARDMFENIRKCSNHLGLFSEDIEVATKRLTGNFPQGYSHLAFIQTVMLLETAYNWRDTFTLNSMNPLGE